MTSKQRAPTSVAPTAHKSRKTHIVRIVYDCLPRLLILALVRVQGSRVCEVPVSVDVASEYLALEIPAIMVNRIIYSALLDLPLCPVRES